MPAMTDAERAAMPSVVAYCPKCGDLIGAAVQAPDYTKEAAKAASDWINAGLKIATITVAEVRAAKWCQCPRDNRKRGRSA